MKIHINTVERDPEAIRVDLLIWEMNTNTELVVIRHRERMKYLQKIKAINRGGEPISLYRNQFYSAHGTAFSRLVL